MWKESRGVKYILKFTVCLCVRAAEAVAGGERGAGRGGAQLEGHTEGESDAPPSLPDCIPYTSLSHCIPSLSLGHCRDGQRGGHFKTTHKSILITLMWIAFSLLYPVLYYVRYFRLHTAYHWLMYTSSYTMFADGGGQQRYIFRNRTF